MNLELPEVSEYLKQTLIMFLFKSSRPEVFCKKMFLEISQNSQENTCARVAVNFAKFLRTLFLTEHQWLLLFIDPMFRVLF